MKKLLLIVSFALMLNNALAQCMLYPVPFSERVQNASLIVEGTLTSKSHLWNAQQNFIYTVNQVTVHKIFKGVTLNQTIEIITEGGEIGNVKITAEPNLEIKTGESGIYFLNNATAFNTAPNQYETYASVQGMIKYNSELTSATDPFNQYGLPNNVYQQIISLTGNNFQSISALPAVTSTSNFMLVPPTISGIAPAVTTAGTFSTVTITGTNFGASYVAGTSNLEFRDANNGGAGFIATPANHIVSWNNTTIQAWVPTQAGSGNIRVTNNLGEATISAATITVNYNESNVNSGGVYYQPDLISDNGTGGYTWLYNTTFNGNAPAVAAFERALQTWRCGTLVNFNRSGTTATSCQALDGNNIVTFDGSCALPAGVLGVSYSYYSSCGSGVWYVNENDLKFRTNGTGGINWNYGPVATAGGLFDFESVCLHELGHSHQLGHTITPVTVMNYAIGPNTDRRTLTAISEVAGGNDILSRSVVLNSCGPSQMILLTAGSCAINAPIANFSGTPTTGCNSLNVTFTDLSVNTPTTWNWSFPGGTPVSSNLQNPPLINYASPGTYTVTLTVSNASGSDTETKTNYITVNNCPPPIADFSASPTVLCAGSYVQFADLSTNTPTSWSWTFAGGTPAASALQNPLIQYNVPGVYSVTLTATNPYGNGTITKTNYITVNTCPPAPVANFTGAPTTICAGATVNFTDLSTNTPTGWNWTFGGGTPATSIAQNPSVVFNTPGVFTITLTATNSGGSNTFTRSNYITVNSCAPPVSSFAGYPTTICAGQSVSFVDLSTNAPTSWSWSFPGGVPAVSALQNPVISYAAAGTYNVTLTASNGNGTGTTYTLTNYVTVSNCPPAGSGLVVNDGSFIYLQPGALIHVDGGVINQDNGANIGTWDNRGSVRVQGDWTNNSVSNAFINSSPGIVELFGANQTLGGSTQTNFYTLQLTGSGIKTQTVNQQVEGTLALNDRELATQGNFMTVVNAAVGAITRTGALNSIPVQGFVSSTGNGRLIRNTNSTGAYLFPVGSSTVPARFRPVALTPVASTAAAFGVRMVNSDPTLSGYNRLTKEPILGTINANWFQKINRTSGTVNAAITIYADDVQDAIATWPTLLMTQWGYNAPPVWWKNINGTPTAAASPVLGNITRSGWSDFSNTENFNIAPQSNPLPVDLLNFSGKCTSNKINLVWTTASEVNSDYFLIESSNDGNAFIAEQKIAAAGNSNSTLEYRFTKNSNSDINYYRLTQVDLNGISTVYKPIAVNCRIQNNNQALVDLFPNPAKDVLVAGIKVNSTQRIKLSVVNMLGQLVIEKEFELENGYHQKTIDISQLAEDVYTVIIDSNDIKSIKRFAHIK